MDSTLTTRDSSSQGIFNNFVGKRKEVRVKNKLKSSQSKKFKPKKLERESENTSKDRKRKNIASFRILKTAN
jgi:hypothetical protein